MAIQAEAPKRAIEAPFSNFSLEGRTVPSVASTKFPVIDVQGSGEDSERDYKIS